jgi:hypothetical protein
MPESNPHESDAVLGGQNPPSINAAVLGGFAGIQAMSKSQSAIVKMQALTNAIEYGDRGIDLAFNLLKDTDYRVYQLARKLIKPRIEKQANEELSKISNLFPWELKKYDPKKRIKDTSRNAYAVTMNGLQHIVDDKCCDLSEFNLLKQDSNVERMQALFFEIDNLNNRSARIRERQLKAIAETLSESQPLLKNLKAFCIGKRIEEWTETYTSSGIHLWDFSYFLNIFPDLEILHIYGDCGCEYKW